MREVARDAYLLSYLLSCSPRTRPRAAAAQRTAREADPLVGVRSRSRNRVRVRVRVRLRLWVRQLERRTALPLLLAGWYCGGRWQPLLCVVEVREHEARHERAYVETRRREDCELGVDHLEGIRHWALGHWTLGSGNWASGNGHWAVGIGHWGIGHWASGIVIGHWASDIGHWALAFGVGHWALGHRALLTLTEPARIMTPPGWKSPWQSAKRSRASKE